MILPYNTTVLAAVCYHAEHSPEKICLLEAETESSLTYAELWERIKIYAGVFFRMGVKKNTNVVIKAHQTIEFIASMFGVQLVGGCCVPVDRTLGDEKLSALAEDYEADIVVDAETIRFVDGHSEKISEIVDRIAAFSWYEGTLPQKDDRCLILSTTGTTGKSKGVMLSHYNRYTGAVNWADAVDLSEEDTVLIPIALSHSQGLNRVDSVFICGGTVLLMSNMMFLPFVFHVVTKHYVTIMCIFPAHLAYMLEKGEQKLKELSWMRVISISSAVTPENHRVRLHNLLPDVRIFLPYGATEAAGTYNIEYTKHPTLQQCIGCKSYFSEVVIVDKEGTIQRDSSPQNPGIIAVKGANVMQGYWKNEELTRQTLRQGLYISSDMGYVDTDGFAYLLGRRDDMIVSGANKLSPFEIEDALIKSGRVKECACVPVDNAIMGQIPVLFFVSEKFTAEDVHSYLSGQIESFKIPKINHIIAMDELPKIANIGKVSRKGLKELARHVL